MISKNAGLKKVFLASAATIAMCGAAYAADLPNRQVPPLAPIVPGSCTDPVTFITTACPLTYYGVTFYGTIDIGAGYETHGAPFNKNIVTGVSELIRANATGGRFLQTPNGLSQSNIGLKGVEAIAPGFDFIFDVNFGFDPYSFQAANGPKSLVDNNGVALANQTSNADSSRAGQVYNTTGYVGVKSARFGTLTFGHQYSLELDAVNAYDPMGGSYAFSVIGWQGTAVGGGDTEDSRVTSIKYRDTVGNDWFRIAGLVQVGGYDLNNATQASYEGGIGKDFNLGPYGQFSADAIYTYDKGAVAAGALSAAQNLANPGTLTAKISDDQSFMLVGKYTYDRLKVFGGYEYIDFADPSSPPVAGFSGIAGYNFSVVNNTAFLAHHERLQIIWTGARYAFTPKVDAGVAYYHYDQNNYGAGAACSDRSKTTCSGQLNAASFDVDYKIAPKFDVYAGTMYTVVSNGLASGYLHKNNLAPTAGLRFKF